jgi:hypothetical protein
VPVHFLNQGKHAVEWVFEIDLAHRSVLPVLRSAGACSAASPCFMTEASNSSQFA